MATDTRIAKLEAALAEARPYVYQALCTARAEGQTWRAETAEPILERVDEALDWEKARG